MGTLQGGREDRSMPEDGLTPVRTRATWLAGMALLVGVTLACGSDLRQAATPTPNEAGPLRIGLLLNFSEGATGRAVERQRAFDLAVKHVNAGGGVFGKPVEVVVGDSTLDPDTAAEEARRMIEEEGVHAIVGPSSSANALVVAERVTGPAGVPAISPSATSPTLTGIEDDDFFFRTALSDSAQGPVLARVAREQGFTNVGLLYRDDAWGRGLFESFEEAWTGPLRSVPIPPGRTSYLTHLRETATSGEQALILLTFEEEAQTIIREATEHGLYDQFVFGDALRSPDLVKAVGGDRVGGMYGTASAAPPDSVSSSAWDAAYVAEYGGLPMFGYVRETYDAAVALALAAQAAGSVDGAVIRDRLRAIGGGPGEVVIAGRDGVADALRILAEGGEIDYEGVSATLDWDENGDLRRGYIGVWRFTEDERIEELESVPFEY